MTEDNKGTSNPFPALAMTILHLQTAPQGVSNGIISFGIQKRCLRTPKEVELSPPVTLGSPNLPRRTLHPFNRRDGKPPMSIPQHDQRLGFEVFGWVTSDRAQMSGSWGPNEVHKERIVSSGARLQRFQSVQQILVFIHPRYRA